MERPTRVNRLCSDTMFDSVLDGTRQEYPKVRLFCLAQDDLNTKDVKGYAIGMNVYFDPTAGKLS